jgi:hypothetical protein
MATIFGMCYTMEMGKHSRVKLVKHGRARFNLLNTELILELQHVCNARSWMVSFAKGFQS